MEGSSTNGQGQNGPAKQLPVETLPIFREGIYLILSRWSALELAVKNEWGGRASGQLADQIGSDVFSWFTQSKEPLYIDDLENILDEGMLSLNTMIEDGSIEEVAEKLMIMHEECLDGNFNSIEKLKAAGPRMVAHQHVRQAVDDDDNEEDDDDDSQGDDRSNMMVDAPEFQLSTNSVNTPVHEQRVDEGQDPDGWVVVSSKKNRGKKN